jgi:hypothetical protein
MSLVYIKKGNQQRKCVVTLCKLCGTEFSAAECEIRRGGGKFCSRTCQRAFQARINAEAMRVDISRSERNEQWKKSVPLEVRDAHDAVERAIANGTLVRQTCEVCGYERVDAHHDDYTKPLDVRWLCRSHHLKHHRSAK